MSEVPIKGKVVGQIGEATYIETNYEANLTFTREWKTTVFDGFKLGRGWEYTPADELRDRLNDSLQGKQPATPINTRYWRNQ